MHFTYFLNSLPFGCSWFFSFFKFTEVWEVIQRCAIHWSNFFDLAWGGNLNIFWFPYFSFCILYLVPMCCLVFGICSSLKQLIWFGWSCKPQAVLFVYLPFGIFPNWQLLFVPIRLKIPSGRINQSSLKQLIMIFIDRWRATYLTWLEVETSTFAFKQLNWFLYFN